MDKKKYKRVNFRISQCSSEDNDYPVSELLLQSPNAKGWQSKRFCQYPQTIVYELVQPTIIKQISILSHQSKIATKVVIHSKLDANKQWARLGFLTLESNVNSNYQTRELKTVNVHDKPCQYLKFTFEANYVNNHNIFNQVGVISLCVFGDRLAGPDESEKPGTGNLAELDRNTMAKIKTLELQKKDALDNQDYDKAQSIKNQIDRLKNLGQTLMLLQEKKKKAVENQNYEDAKIINQKIKKLRDAEGGGPNFSTRPSGTPSDYFRSKKTQFDEQQPSISPQTYSKKPEPARNNPPPPAMKQQRSPPKRVSPPKKPSAPTNSFDEDRPIQVKNSNPYQNAEDDGPKQQEGDDGQVAPLSKEIKAECSQYFNIFDEQIFAHLFSANFNNRERGLNLAKDEVAGGPKNNQVIQAWLYVVKKMIDDKNISVLLSTLDFFAMGLKKLKPGANGTFNQMADEILQKASDYLGHTNQKVRRTTEELYLSLPNYPLFNKDVCYDSLSRIGKRDKPPKILTGRLKILHELVCSYQLGKNYDSVIKYAIKYADDKNSDVRNAAIQLICTISNEIGYASMQPHLKVLRPQIIKSIEQRFQEAGGEDNRNPDDRPVGGAKKQNNQGQKIPIKHKREQFEEAENEFIDVPNPKNITNPEYTCDFCQRFDKKFENEDYRDLHLYNACPMLMICQQCGQAVEISTYTSHQVGECKNSKYFKKCPRCKEAVHQGQYKVHVEKKQCIPAKPPATANRCPLCHLDIDPGKEGWKNHLVDVGCENNPRK